MLLETFSPFVIIYFIVLIFIGALFLMNLAMAVVKYSFTETNNKLRL